MGARWGMLIGYARVSTLGQNLARQKALLSEAGCTKIFEEKITGTNRKRPQLLKALGAIQSGDTLIVTSLDRLARSTHNLFQLTQMLEDKEAGFKSLREPWADKTSPMGKFLLAVFSGLSELEGSLIRERTEEGRIAAQQRGVKFGHKLKLTSHQREEVQRMLNEGIALRAVARHFNVGVATIDRIKNNAFLPIV